MSNYPGHILAAKIRCVCGRVNSVEEGEPVACACGAMVDMVFEDGQKWHPNVVVENEALNGALENRKINRPEVVSQQWELRWDK